MNFYADILERPEGLKGRALQCWLDLGFEEDYGYKAIELEDGHILVVGEGRNLCGGCVYKNAGDFIKMLEKIGGE